jgi:hypothetical protein
VFSVVCWKRKSSRPAARNNRMKTCGPPPGGKASRCSSIKEWRTPIRHAHEKPMI